MSATGIALIRRPEEHLRSLLVVVVTLMVAGSSAAGQTASSKPAGSVGLISLSHFIHATDTLEPTLAFYRDVFGLEGPPPRVNSNPGVALLNNKPGIALRASSPKFPGETFAIEMTEF